MSASLLYLLVPVVLFGTLYIIYLLVYTWGWFTLKPYKNHDDAEPYTRLSLIIPARNEENNILNLLEDIAGQNYPAALMEVIVVDDHSTDKTALLVRQFIASHSDRIIRLLSMKNNRAGMPYKKKAISYAISQSNGDLIITTDSDCRVHPEWLRKTALFYQEYKPRMIVGPVSFHNERNLFQHLQTPEFLSLIAITAGSVNIGRPVMCNGANLAYEKEAFYEVGGFGNQDDMPSGDDVFLLLKIRKRYGGSSIRFIRSREAVVLTEAKRNPREFMQQRIRWASKNKAYDLKILMVSSTVYFTNLLLIAGLIHLAWHPGDYRYIAAMFLAKILTDLPILTGVLIFIRRAKLLIYAAPLILVYPFYIALTGALGIIGGYTWKGRTHRNSENTKK